jgi:hypothetical protein
MSYVGIVVRMATWLVNARSHVTRLEILAGFRQIPADSSSSTLFLAILVSAPGQNMETVSFFIQVNPEK